jgi:hypothetical protein
MFTSLTQNVFLCLAKDNNFECKQFKDFIEADGYFTDHCNYNVKSTMIDRCKFYPDSLRAKTLKKELTSLFKDVEDIKIVKEFNSEYLQKVLVHKPSAKVLFE